MKFTFKRYPRPKGLARITHRDAWGVKLNGNEVGQISTEPNYKLCVRFMVMKQDPHKSENPNCPWKWVQFPGKFDKYETAKLWVLSNAEAALKAGNYTLKQFD